MDLIEISKKDKGIVSLFSEFIIVDWYDGIVTGAARLESTDKWYLCNMCYFDPGSGQRIYALLQASDQQISQLRMYTKEEGDKNNEFYEKAVMQVRDGFSGYSGKVYLMKVKYLDNSDYDIVEIPLKYLKFFNDIEDVLNQDQGSKLQWLDFFTS